MTDTGPGHDDFAPGWGQRWAAHEIQRRLDAGLNAIVLIIGPSGSGKSWAALKLAEMVDPLFDPKVHLVFTLDALLELLDTDGAIQPGDVIVFDEAGVGVGSRESMSKVNRIFSAVIESVRFRQFALLFTVPDLAQIDVNAVRMAHMVLESMGVDRRVGRSQFKPKHPRRDPTNPDALRLVYPVLSRKDGPKYKLKHISFERPSDGLVTEYENLRAVHIQSVYARMHGDRQAQDLKLKNDRLREEIRAQRLERASKEGSGLRGPVGERSPEDILRMRESGMSVIAIATEDGCSVDWVYKRIATAKARRAAQKEG